MNRRQHKGLAPGVYIPESHRKGRCVWKKKDSRLEASYRRNRRNTNGPRVRDLQRLRSEKVERTFAHQWDPAGGARRTWLCGLNKVRKRYLTVAMAYNLGRIMRQLLGADKPRLLAVLAEKLSLTQTVLEAFQKLTKRLRPPLSARAANPPIAQLLAA